ncbi:hypothetical protein NDU88_003162 [Pleurodeles waltl]|uniref:Uncharacterized protein n=1 Tax=Pleurodeles waltl TaxID=8319 RepID=A0AAV7LGB1_PLEWA|nr:hypothetical protein NDU88_003162 [Pleurodeles waltl]
MAKITEVAQGAPAASAGNAAWRVITISTVLCYDVTLEPLVWGILWVAVGVEEAGGEGSSACTVLSGAAK